MSWPIRPSLLAIALASSIPVTSTAGTLAGRVELPPAPERPPPRVKGFLDRAENALAIIRPPAVAPYIVVALEGEPKPSADPGLVNWELAGDSFVPPVLIVQLNTNVIIKNQSRVAHTMVAAEDAALIPPGPINPTSPKAFRVPTAAVYTVADKAAAHLKGTLVVVDTPFVATVDASGKFQLEAPPGTYKLRVFYRDKWTTVEETVNIPLKGKAPDVSVKGLVSPKK